MKRFILLNLFFLLIITNISCTPSNLINQEYNTSFPTGENNGRSETNTSLFTSTPTVTLSPQNIEATIYPLLQDPINCSIPCFWGIIPKRSSMEEVNNFFNSLSLIHRQGKDNKLGLFYYSVNYDSFTGGDSSVIFYSKDNTLIDNIVIVPDNSQQERNRINWSAFSPENLINKFGQPSRISLALDRGPNYVIGMIIYFETADLIAFYSGYNMIPERPDNPQLCPLTASFDHIWLGEGLNPPDAPSFTTVPLEKATSLTVEEFYKLVINNPQQACFIIKGEVFN
jgi:hypothetical protein